MRVVRSPAWVAAHEEKKRALKRRFPGADGCLVDDDPNALSPALEHALAVAGGRAPAGFRTWLDEARSTASVRVRGGLHTLVAPSGTRWRVVARGLTKAQVREYQEKKCGRSGISDDKTCHVGGGETAGDSFRLRVVSSGVKKKKTLGSSCIDHVNTVIDVTLRDGTHLICKPDAGRGEVTDDQLRAYLDGNPGASVSQHPEEAAANLDRMLGIGAGTPRTTVVDNLPGLGRVMAQEFVPGLTPNTDPATCDSDSVARVAVLDAIMGNVDRHGGNMMSVEGPDGSRRLIAVDNGLPAEYAMDYAIGSGTSRAVAYTGAGSTAGATPHQRAAWEASQRVIASLPDVDFETWERHTSDGSRLGSQLARESYRRYQRTRELGAMCPPREW